MSNQVPSICLAKFHYQSIHCLIHTTLRLSSLGRHLVPETTHMAPQNWTSSQQPQVHRSPLSRVSQAAGNPSNTHPAEQTLPHRPAPTGLRAQAWNSGDQPTKLTRDPAAPKPNDGFTTVSRLKSARRGEGGPPVSASANYWRSDFGGRSSKFGTSATNPRAGGRPGQNMPQASACSSHYRQSALPVEERDPVLLEVEQNTGRKISKELYKPGMIIRAILHEPHFNPTSTVVDSNRTQSIFGPIHSKYRKMIVIALYEGHYIAIPLYTHNGNGLTRKSRPDEYVSVKDHRSKAPFITLSTHLALETETLNPGVEQYEATTVAHLTYPICRSYDLPVIQEGHLEANSLSHLLQLYKKCSPRTRDS